MTDDIWDESRKLRVKAELKAQAEAALAASRQAVAEERGAAELDQDDVQGVDDLSQSDEGGDLHELLGAAAERQAGLVEQIEALDVGPKDVVEPGAIVAFGGDHYIVGVVADEFEVDGVTFEGISADSPVLAAASGLRAGDSFTVNDVEHRLDLVV